MQAPAGYVKSENFKGYSILSWNILPICLYILLDTVRFLKGPFIFGEPSQLVQQLALKIPKHVLVAQKCIHITIVSWSGNSFFYIAF